MLGRRKLSLACEYVGVARAHESARSRATEVPVGVAWIRNRMFKSDSAPGGSPCGRALVARLKYCSVRWRQKFSELHEHSSRAIRQHVSGRV